MLAEIFIPMTFFATVFGVLYVFFTTRNKERLAMIEKGADPSLFSWKFGRIGIKIGLVAMGIALGVLVGALINHTTKMNLDEATFSMIFLFGGSGLVFDHYLAKKESK